MSARPGPGAVRAARAVLDRRTCHVLLGEAAAIISEQSGCDAMAAALEYAVRRRHHHMPERCQGCAAVEEALRLHREGPAK
jgi:hypothetical protein